jgi:DNA primase
MQAVLDGAEPMVGLLWRRETEGQVFDSPERRAALDKRLRERLGTIRDPVLRRTTARRSTAARELFFNRRAPRPRRAPGGRFRAPRRAGPAGDPRLAAGRGRPGGRGADARGGDPRRAGRESR